MENLDNKVSIVLATYNGAKYLRVLLDSLLKQTVRPYEIIIIDDCSRDNTLDIIATYASLTDLITTEKNEINLGPIKSFAKGIQLAKGEYIALADQDDIWFPEKIEKSLRLILDIETPGTAAMIYTDLSVVDESGQIIHESFWAKQHFRPKKERLYTLLFSNIVTGCTILFNRPLALLIKTIPAEALMHDHWICLVSTALGVAKPCFMPTVYYRQHENTVTSKENISFFQRIKNNLQLTFRKNEYLKRNFEQAEAFKTSFYELLSQRDKAELDYFLELKKLPLYRQKIASILRYWRGERN